MKWVIQNINTGRFETIVLLAKNKICSAAGARNLFDLTDCISGSEAEQVQTVLLNKTHFKLLSLPTASSASQVQTLYDTVWGELLKCLSLKWQQFLSFLFHQSSGFNLWPRPQPPLSVTSSQPWQEPLFELDSSFTPSSFSTWFSESFFFSSLCRSSRSLLLRLLSFHLFQIILNFRIKNIPHLLPPAEKTGATIYSEYLYPPLCFVECSNCHFSLSHLGLAFPLGSAASNFMPQGISRRWYMQHVFLSDPGWQMLKWEWCRQRASFGPSLQHVSRVELHSWPRPRWFSSAHHVQAAAAAALKPGDVLLILFILSHLEEMSAISHTTQMF